MLDKRICKATQKDIPHLLHVINSAYRGEAAKEGWTHEADLIAGSIRADENYLREIMHDGSAAILKLTVDDAIQGCVYLQEQGEKAYLGMLSVSPRVQSGGFGKALLKASEEWARDKNKTSIIMNVISERATLIAWYERNGYKDSGIRRPFPDETKFGIPRKEVEFMVMEKKLMERYG